jgi:hypothetical protein
MAKTGEPTKPRSGYLTREALLEEDGGPAHTGTTLVPAAPKFQQVVHQANKAGIRVVDATSTHAQVEPPVKRSVSPPLIRARGTRRLAEGRPRAVAGASSRGGDSGDSSEADSDGPGPGSGLTLDQLARRPLTPRRDLLRHLAERRRALDALAHEQGQQLPLEDVA